MNALLFLFLYGAFAVGGAGFMKKMENLKKNLGKRPCWCDSGEDRDSDPSGPDNTTCE